MITDHDYRCFCLFIEDACGIVLGANKQYLVRSRLTPLLAKFKLGSLSELFILLQNKQNRELEIAAIDAMTTNETLWFRDEYPFSVLKTTLLPNFSKLVRPIRIWSAASASGQEAYSIAMTILEYQYAKAMALPCGAQIVGSDLSPSMLAQCREGIYDQLALSRGLSLERKQQFFTNNNDGTWKVNDAIHKMVSFHSLNLKDSYGLMGKFDIIYCRNVLIYFSPETKKRIIQQMARCLHSKGYLILGASESLSGISDQFDMIRCNPGIIYRLKK